MGFEMPRLKNQLTSAYGDHVHGLKHVLIQLSINALVTEKGQELEGSSQH